MNVRNTRSVDDFLSTNGREIDSSLPIKAPGFIGPMTPSGNIVFPGDVTITGALTVESVTLLEQNVVASSHLQITAISNSIPAVKVTSSGTSDILQLIDGDSNEIIKVTSNGNLNYNNQVTINATSGDIASNGVINAVSGFAYNSNTVSAGASLDLSLSNSSLINPKGSAAQRPVTGIPGMMRYNTDSAAFEGFSGSTPEWSAIGGAASGPVWTPDTKSYTSPGTFQTPGQQISASTLTGTPTNLFALCQTSNFAIFSDRGASPFIWLFTNVSSTWGFAARYATMYITNSCKCVGNQIVLMSTDGGVLSNVSEWLFVPGTPGSMTNVRTITNAGGALFAGLDFIANHISFYDMTYLTVRVYSFDGISTWTAMTNFNFAAGFTPGNSGSTILCTTPFQLITVDNSSTTGVFRIYALTAGNPGSINTTPVQTITLAPNTPAGFNSYLYCQPLYDGSNVSETYLHFIANQSNCGGTQLGGLLSYQYSGGSWVYRQNAILGQVTNSYAGWSNNSPLYYGGGNGVTLFSDTLTVRCYNSEILQFNLIKTALSPFIAYTLASSFFPTGTNFSDNNNICQSADGQYLSVFCNNGATPEYVNFFLRSPNGTTDVLYQNTVENVEISGNLFVNGPYLRLPVTSSGNIQSLTPALPPGLIFVDSVTGTLKYLFNNSWQTLAFGSSSGGTGPTGGYIPGSGNLNVGGGVTSVSQINSGVFASTGTTQIKMPNQPYDTVVLRFDGQLAGSVTLLSQTRFLADSYAVAWIKNGTGDYNLNFTATNHVSSINKVVCAGSCLIWGSSPYFINAKQATTANLQVGTVDSSNTSFDTAGCLTCFVIRN